MINITAIGDSIIDAVGRCSVTELTQWPYLLLTERLNQTVTMEPFSPWTGGDKGPNNKLIGTNIDPEGEDYTFYNAGIGSETTSTMLSRFDADGVPELGDVTGHPTDIVIILGGVNDLSIGYAALGITHDELIALIKSNLIGMYDKCDFYGYDVVAATILPWNNGDDVDHNDIRVINDWIRITASHRGYGLVDWYSILENPEGSGHMIYSGGETITNPWGDTVTVSGPLSCDGVHVNVEGQRVMANTFDLAQLSVINYDLYARPRVIYTAEDAMHLHYADTLTILLDNVALEVDDAMHLHYADEMSNLVPQPIRPRRATITSTRPVSKATRTRPVWKDTP